MSSAHRSTRANLAAVSRRCRALSGAASITARAIAARSPPGVSLAARSHPQASLLMTQPGVGPITALAFVLTIGDVSRFKHSGQVASYLHPSDENLSPGTPGLRRTADAVVGARG